METHNQTEKETRNTCGSTKKPDVFCKKPATLVGGDVRKERLTDKLIPAQEKPEKYPRLTKKSVLIEKPMTLADGHVKKERPIENEIPVHEKPETKLGLTKKPDQVEKPMTLADDIMEKIRFAVTAKQPEKNNTDISLKRIEKYEQKERGLCEWRRIKVERERQKQKQRKQPGLHLIW